MARIFLLIILIVFVLLLYRRYRIYSFFRSYQPNSRVPKLIHLIYIPWDKNQRLKQNYMDFSQTFYHDMVKQYPDFHIEMWTLPKLKKFVSNHYPNYESTVFNLPRPTMIVDFLRLLIVYHYGGIYWQYDNKCHTNIEYFLPRADKNVKLLTELVLTDDLCKRAIEHPIRNGIPEEPIRICNQIFSAVPRHPYLLKLFERAIENMKRVGDIKSDYDILYIGANAMMSQMYNEVGKYQSDIELLPLSIVRGIVSISSKGSWRTDNKNFIEQYLHPNILFSNIKFMIHHVKHLV